MPVVTQTTLLDAVNRCLATIGQRPATTLSGTLTADVASALATVNEIDLAVQSKGWAFNTERVLLTPTANKIAVPTNVVRVGVSRSEYPNLDITIRDDSGTARLYDKKTNSFTITTPIYATTVTLYDLVQTPESYRRYVTIKASRVFCDRALSDQAKHAFSEQDAQAAYRELLRHENKVDPMTIFSSWPAAGIMMRGSPTRGQTPIEFG
jgi:Autographiviridae tail tubular protein Gp11